MSARFLAPKKDRLGVILIAVVVFGLLAIGAIAYAHRPAALDRETLCLRDAPAPASVAILSDATDRLSARHRKRLQRAVQAEVASLPKHARLMVFSLDARQPREPKLVFAKCNPGRGADVNALFDNPRRVEKLFEQEFMAPLQAELEKAAHTRDARVSPILEGVWAVSTDPDFAAAKRRLVLISDMMQHTKEGVSLYRDGDVSVTPQGPDRPDVALNGAEVRLVVLDRPEHSEKQARAIDGFWRPLLEEAGARQACRCRIDF